MDRALKERIIGAIVLVVTAILVVPVFLDGRSDESGTIHAAVSLPGQDGRERKTQTIVLDRDRTEPLPAADQRRQETRAKIDVAAAVASDQIPARGGPSAAPAISKSAQSATGMWAVQLGSFSKQGNAEKLASELRNQGYAAFLSQLKTGDGPLHRVRVGPQKDRDSAEAIAARLDSAGHKGQVVPHP